MGAGPAAAPVRSPASSLDGVRQEWIDGVPAYVTEGPAPLSAGLVFGVGRRDETFVRGGLTHLVEHLAMSRIGRTTLDANASVELASTEFTATGRPERVVEFLRSVCLALGDLPTERLPIEAGVLAAEDGHVVSAAVAGLLGELYGAVGLGLAASRDPALLSLTADDVRQWAALYFNRENAALWLAGPVPAGIALPLPGGARPHRAAQYRKELPTPGWFESALSPETALGAEVVRRPAVGPTLRLLRDRVEDELRHRRGIAYAIGTEQIGVDTETDLVVVTSDSRPGRESAVAQGLWQQLRHLAEHGPLPAEIEHDQAVVAEYLDDPRSRAAEVAALAQGHVTATPVPTVDELRRQSREITAEDIRQVAADLRDGTVLAVPAIVEPGFQGLERLRSPSSGPVSGRTFRRRRLSSAPKGSRLVLGSDGATLVLHGAEDITVRWQDAVGLLRAAPDDVTLIARDGQTIPLVASEWHDGQEAIAVAEQAVPPELQADDDDLHEQGVGALLLHAPPHRAREALWLSNWTGTVAQNDDWTVLRATEGQAAEQAADVSHSLGRKHVALLLTRHDPDVRYVLLRHGRELDRHTWHGTPGSTQALSDALGHDPDEVAGLLAASGSPDEVVEQAIRVLGLPPQTSDVLAGREIEHGQQVQTTGLRAGMRASARGEFDPQGAEASGVIGRWNQLAKERPRWYRAANGVATIVLGLLAWLLASRADADFLSWTALLALFAAVMAAGCLWDTRPPRSPADHPLEGRPGHGSGTQPPSKR